MGQWSPIVALPFTDSAVLPEEPEWVPLRDGGGGRRVETERFSQLDFYHNNVAQYIQLFIEKIHFQKHEAVVTQFR